MFKKSLLALITAAWALSTSSTVLADQRGCDKVKADIRRIQSRMRQPHSAKQSARWSASLRKLRKTRARLCR